MALHQKSGSDTRDGSLVLNKLPLLVVACNFGAKPGVAKTPNSPTNGGPADRQAALHQKSGSNARDGSSVLNKSALVVVACNFGARPLEPRVGILHQKFFPPICPKNRPEPKALDATSRPLRTAGNVQSAERGHRFFSSLRRVYCSRSSLIGRLRAENRSPRKTDTKSRIRRPR